MKHEKLITKNFIVKNENTGVPAVVQRVKNLTAVAVVVAEARGVGLMPGPM